MAAVVVNPQDWSASSPINYLIGLGNQAYNVHNAGSGYTFNSAATHALTSPDGNALRFEVRSGDHNWFDIATGSGSERSEISSTDHIDYGTPLHISYNFNLEPGAPNTAKWMVIGQIHQVMPENVKEGVPPPVAVTMIGERMAVSARYMDANGKVIEQVIYKDSANIVRGHDYDIDIKAVFDADGQGRLVVVRDGVAIADYAGKLGYAYEGQVYWKEGVYRSPASETTAAVFSDLKISHGDMVQIPTKGNADATLTQAPTITYESGDAGGSGAKIMLSGTAAAGAEVRVYVGENLAYSTRADASGHFTVEGNLASGSHIVTAAVVGADGRLSAVSNELAFDVGTGSEILGRISAIDAKYDLSSIFLTDGNLIKVASVGQISDLLKNASQALEKVDGDFGFVFYSGTADNRTTTTYDSHGIALDAVTRTLSSGVLVRETLQHFEKDAPYAKEVYQYQISGQAYTSSYQGFDAANKLIVSTQTYATGIVASTYKLGVDGLGTTEAFNISGVHTSTTLKHAAGDGSGLSSEVHTYNISGQTYMSTYSAYNTGGALIESRRMHADGSLDYSFKLQADGSTLAMTYSASNALTTKLVTAAGGSSVREAYDSAGVLTLKNIVLADKTTEAISFTNGVMSSKTVVHNASDAIYKEAYTYTTASATTYVSSYKAYGVDNKMIGTERYFANGQKEYEFWIDANGTSVTTRYVTNGAKTSESTVYANGITDSKTYTSNLLTRETIVLNTADASGATKYVYDFNIANKTYASMVTAYNAFGAVISTKTFAGAVVPTALESRPETPTLDLSTYAPQMLMAFAARSALGDNGGGEPLIVGTAEAGSSIALYRGDAQVAVTKADADGHFSFKVAGLADGSQILTAKAFDAAGRYSDASETVAVNVFHGQGNGSAVAGSFGSDFLFGTSGDDTFIINRAGDVVIDHGGTDLVKSSISYTLGDGIENLRLAGSGHISGIGNAADNSITGNDGNNLIDGMGCADRMAGGLGNDTYVVDNRNDKIVEYQDQGIDTVVSYINYSLGATVENLTLIGTEKIGGTGNALANTLIGNSNANSLSGGAGDDRLDGGLGSDLLRGGTGADSFVFSTTLSPSNIDTILDFEQGRDHIELASDIFKGLQPGALNTSLFKDIASDPVTVYGMILYDSTNGTLYFDTDAAGAQAPVRFATLTGHGVLTADDFLIV